MADVNQTESEMSVEASGPRRVSAGIHSSTDVADDKDALGFEPYVQAAVDFIWHEKTRAPLTLSIEGAWGSGKSSFMCQMMRKLRDRQATVIKFNAWRHDKDESLWAAFALALVEQLRRTLPWHHRVWATLKLLALRYDRGAGLVPMIRYLSKSILWLTLTGFLVWYWVKGRVRLSDMEEAQSVWKLVALILGSGGSAVSVFGLTTIVRQVVRTMGNPLRHDLSKYFKTVDYAQRVTFIEQFHQDLPKILEAYAGKKKVFVFIDDLDRCEVPRAADLMSAINLLIDEENNLVFILGLDREKVAAGLAVKFEQVVPYVKRWNDRGEESGETNNDRRQLRHAGIEFGYEFIEKFIQLPIRVPVPQPSDLNTFLDSLGRETSQPVQASKGWSRRLSDWWKGFAKEKPSGMFSNAKGASDPREAGLPEDEETRDWNRFELRTDRDSEDVLEIARMVAPAMDHNPRRLIHFMNNFRLRAYTAYRTGLFNPRQGVDSPLRLEQLGKFVAIALRWPLLIYELEQNPAILAELAYVAEEGGDPSAIIPPRWLACQPLLDLLAYGAKDNEQAHERFTMTSLDVTQLLRVSPAVAPKPAQEPAEASPPPDDKEPESSSGIDFVERAYQLVNEGQLEEAERLYQQALLQEPRNSKIVLALGDLLKKTKRYEEAIEQYILAREINPDDPQAYIQRGLLYEETGVPEKALTMYQEALEHGAGDDIKKRIEEISRRVEMM